MQPAFLPQTTLHADQQRTNFTLIDNPVIDLLTSREAEKICSKMFLIYTRLKRAPWAFFERPGVLQINGDGARTAWQILCELAGVASATLNKAIQWMKERRVIGYWAGKNGAGIRIFFNVAVGSIKAKEQKNLRLVPASFDSADTSANAAPFKDSFAVQDNQNLERRALRDEPAASALPAERPTNDSAALVAPTNAPTTPKLQLVREPASDLRLALLEAIVRKFEALERTVHEALRQMPDAQWLENAAIPKAVRVALAEVFRREQGRGQPKLADVGSRQPQLSEAALAEYEAVIREEEWAEAALRALSDDEYEQRMTRLITDAANNPRYAKITWSDDATKRSHFEAMLKRELLQQHTIKEQV